MSGGIQDSYGVRVTNGILVTCDSAAKQILLHVDASRDGFAKFVLRDVDATHLLVKTEHLDAINQILQDELEKNTYVQDPNM